MLVKQDFTRDPHAGTFRSLVRHLFDGTEPTKTKKERAAGRAARVVSLGRHPVFPGAGCERAFISKLRPPKVVGLRLRYINDVAAISGLRSSKPRDTRSAVSADKKR